MKRASIFVEGQTEQHFVSRLLHEVAGAEHLQVMHSKVSGGLGARSLISHSLSQGDNAKFSIQVIDCGGERTVVPAICEYGPQMLARGIALIIGLRDIYPLKKAKLGAAYREMKRIIEAADTRARVIIPVVEIEAWFIAECTHFARVDSKITRDAVLAKCGWDPCALQSESIGHPAAELNSIYQLGGKGYSKRADQVQLTVDCLDYTSIALDPEMPAALRRFVGVIHRFLRESS